MIRNFVGYALLPLFLSIQAFAPAHAATAIGNESVGSTPKTTNHIPDALELAVSESPAKEFFNFINNNRPPSAVAPFQSWNEAFSPADYAILKTLNDGVIKSHTYYNEILAESGGNHYHAFQTLKEEIREENIKFNFDELGTVFEAKEIVPATETKAAVIVFRVFHKESRRTVLFVDQNAHTEHPKLKQYLAMLSLSSPTDVLAAKSGKLLESKSPFGLRDAFRTRAQAYVEFPPGTVSLAAIASSSQTALVLGSGALASYFGLTNGINPEVFALAGLSFGLGLTLGILHRVQKNWQQKPTDSAAMKAFKKSVIGIPCKLAFFALIYTVGEHGQGLEGLKMFIRPETLNPFGTPEPAEYSAKGLYWFVVENMALSAFARNAFTDIPLQQQAMGGGKEIMSKKIFGKELFGFTQNDFYYSMIYLIPFTLSKVDILFREKVSVFGLFEMGAGRIALVSGALFAASSIYFFQKNQIAKAQDVFDRSGLLRDKSYLDKLIECHKNYVDSQAKVIKKYVIGLPKLLLYKIPKKILSVGKGACASVFSL